MSELTQSNYRVAVTFADGTRLTVYRGKSQFIAQLTAFIVITFTRCALR